jgi:hypothetical protein
MNKTRKLGTPIEDPTTLRDFTIRRGKNGWWRVFDNKWEPIKELKTRKSNDRLVLSDVENHFREYGIEFGMTAGASPKLISELQGLGLLVGSPDAGDSVSVKNPF